MSIFLAPGTSLQELNQTLRLIQESINQRLGTITSPTPSVAQVGGAFSIVGTSTAAVSGVTSVGLTMPIQFTVSGSPITTAGSFAVSWNTEAPNTALMGPISGAAAVPTFRILDQADMPISVWSNRYFIPAAETLRVLQNTALFGGATGLEIAGTIILDGQIVVHYGA